MFTITGIWLFMLFVSFFFLWLSNGTKNYRTYFPESDEDDLDCDEDFSLDLERDRELEALRFFDFDLVFFFFFCFSLDELLEDEVLDELFLLLFFFFFFLSRLRDENVVPGAHASSIAAITGTIRGTRYIGYKWPFFPHA